MRRQLSNASLVEHNLLFKNELIAEAYPYAVKDAARETGLPRATFPSVCPYSVEQLLDENYWP